MYGWMVFQNFSGVDEKTTLSWKYTGEGEDAFQKSCRIRVKDAQGRISDTGEMETERHQGMPFPDMEWRSFTEYQVQVEGKDRGGNLTESGWITFVDRYGGGETFLCQKALESDKEGKERLRAGLRAGTVSILHQRQKGKRS